MSSHPLLAGLHAAVASVQGAPGPLRDGDARVLRVCEAVEAALAAGLRPEAALFSEPKGRLPSLLLLLWLLLLLLLSSQASASAPLSFSLSFGFSCCVPLICCCGGQAIGASSATRWARTTPPSPPCVVAPAASPLPRIPLSLAHRSIDRSASPRVIVHA